MLHNHPFMPYHNKGDLRICFYRNPSRKWMGVRFNFAHAQAGRLLRLGVFLPFLLISVLAVMSLLTLAFFKHQKGIENIDKYLMATAMLVNVLCVLWLGALVTHVHRMAARDAKNNPRKF